jgi:hypothetical protein
MARSGQQEQHDNLSTDPIFCLTADPPLSLRSDSPCAEENNPVCGRIGALGVGCYAPVPVLDASWGSVKYRFR